MISPFPMLRFKHLEASLLDAAVRSKVFDVFNILNFLHNTNV